MLPAWEEVLPAWGELAVWEEALPAWGRLALTAWEEELPVLGELTRPVCGETLAAWVEPLPV